MTDTTETPQTHQLKPLSDRQVNSLLANLNPQRISSRRQSGRELSYLEAWDVKAALIKVFGFGGFSAVASDAKVINTEQVPKAPPRNGGAPPPGHNFRVTVMVKVTLTIHQLGAVYGEYAASSQTNPDPGDAMDFAIKTAESDALKRAAIYLGTQFGLSLYDNGSTNDVVRVILAPGQERPVTQSQPVSRAAELFPTPAEGVTPEQHERNLALVDRAFGMKQEAAEAASEAGGAPTTAETETAPAEAASGTGQSSAE